MSAPLQVHSLGILRSTFPNSQTRSVVVLGKNKPGDGGGGIYTFDSTRASADDSDAVVRPIGYRTSQGAWVRETSGPADVRRQGATGDGTTDDHASLVASLTTGDHVRLYGQHRLASDFDVPAGKVLYFDQGGTLVVDDGKSITGRIALAGAPPTQLFGGLGTLAFVVDCLGPIHAEWFGAVGDWNGGAGPASGTDNAIPLQRAIDCAARSGRHLAIAPGAYRITAPLVVNGTFGVAQYGLTIEGVVAGASGATINTVLACDFAYASEPHGTSFAVGTHDVSSPIVPKLLITGLSGMSAASVGGFLYLLGCGHANNNGPWQIVEYVDPTSVWVNTRGKEPTATDTGTTWRNPQLTGLQILSRDCRVKGLLVTAAPGTVLASAVQDTQGAQGICSNNEFRDVGVYRTGGGVIVNGFSHGDSLVQPGFGPFTFGDCENTRYFGCYSTGHEYAGYFCPNTGGQTKKIEFHACAFIGGRHGIYQASGGFIAERCDVSSTTSYAFVVGLLDQCVISGLQSEGCYRLLLGPYYNSNGADIHIIGGGRIATDGMAADGEFVTLHGAGTLTMAVWFDQTYRAAFKMILGNNASTRPTQFLALGGSFPNASPVAVAQVGDYMSATFLGAKGASSDGTGSERIANGTTEYP